MDPRMSNFFEETFGLDDGVYRRVIATALRQGGEYCDLYFQQRTQNAIGLEDFAGWVQERGLYFAADFGDRYAAPIAWSDPETRVINSSPKPTTRM